MNLEIMNITTVLLTSAKIQLILSCFSKCVNSIYKLPESLFSIYYNEFFFKIDSKHHLHYKQIELTCWKSEPLVLFERHAI